MVSKYARLAAQAQFLADANLEQVTLEFGEWVPDLMTLNSPGATEARNVMPRQFGYTPFAAHAPVADLALPDAARGGMAVITKNNDVRLYAATVNGIFVRAGGDFLQRWATPFPYMDSALWQFVLFGDNLVALHPQTRMLFSNVNVDADFALVDGNPPFAACGARVGDFLVLGNLDDMDGRQPQRIRWGGFNRIDAPWVSDPATQADFQDMPSEGGAVIGIAGREFGTVFQEKIISRMSYRGLPDVFEIETVEEGRGALSVGSIVDIGSQIFFISNDGFFLWNGVNSQPISDGKINKYFFDRLNYGARGRIVGALDTKSGCIWWAFPVGTSTALDEILIYSYRENRWSHAFDTTEYILSSAVLSTSLDDLHEDLDTDYPVSFDDPMFGTGDDLVAGFSTDHEYGTFSGPALEATIDTTESTGSGGRRVFVNAVRPVVDIAEPIITVRVGKKDQFMGEELAYGDPVSQDITGECPVLEDARFIRFRVIIPAGAAWLHARGVDVWRKLSGRR